MALSEATSEAIWLNRLFAELMTGPASNLMTNPALQLIYIDNSGAIFLALNPRHHDRTKHIDV